MAYPTLLTPPLAYTQNFRSIETRNHGRVTRIRGYFDTDTHAQAWATMLGAYTAARQTSLNKRIGEHNFSTTHPTGTRISANVLGVAANGYAERFHLRNFSTAITDFSTAVAALFTGVADATSDVLALTAPPNFHGGGPAIVTVNALPITKHG